jgi:hypothetical protein
MKRTGRNLWEGERDLYFRLLEKPMTWTELKRQTHFSNTTLAVYLKHLTKVGYVHHDPETKTYRPLRYFEKIFPAKTGEAFRLIGELNPLWRVVEKHADAERQDEISEVTVRAHASLLSAAIPLLLYSVVVGAFPRYYGDRKQSVRKFGRERPEERWRNGHLFIDDALENWLGPWIHEILDFLSVHGSSNKDTLLGVGGPILKEALREVERYDRVLKPFRNIPEQASVIS